MAEKVLLGQLSTVGAFGSTNINNTAGSDWQSSIDGVITKVGIYSFSASSGNLKYVIYKDGSTTKDITSPVAYESGSEAISSSGWNYFDITPFGISSGEFVGIYIGQGNAYIRTAIPNPGAYVYANSSFHYSSFFPPDPFGSGWSTASNYDTVAVAIGWELPDITGVNINPIVDGQSRVLNGTDFMDAGDTLTLYLSDSATYGAGTMVAQTVTYHDDTSITFDVVKGALSIGTVYAFAVTDLGQVSTAFSLELASPYFVTEYSLNSIENMDLSTGWNDGMTFPNSDSALVMNIDSSLNINELTIFIDAPNFDDISSFETVLQNGTNYVLSIDDGEIDLNGSTFEFTPSGYRTLSVIAENGQKPRFYLNGEYAGTGDISVTVSSSGATQLYIGNNSSLNSNFSHVLKKVSIYSAVLSDDEIRAAHIMAITDRPF